MLRGEVWWAALPEEGRHPVVTLTRDTAIPVLTRVTVALVTSTIRGIPVEVLLGPDDGMPSLCAVNCDNIHTISKVHLQSRICALDVIKIYAIEQAIKYALDLP
jgi:mRNA interferase MazF